MRSRRTADRRSIRALCREWRCRVRSLAVGLLAALWLLPALPSEAAPPKQVAPRGKGLLATERLPGKGVWVDPALGRWLQRAGRVRATVWLDEQLLGDGAAYPRRAKEFAGRKRTELRLAATKTLQALSERSRKTLADPLAKLVASGAVRALEWHWIVNGFSCGVTAEGLEALKRLDGARKIFGARIGPRGKKPETGDAPTTKPAAAPPFDPQRYKHPWYVRQLLADRVWAEFGVAGKGTLNIVHDFNFLFSENLNPCVYWNEGEIPANGEDDDGNGLVDDVHGYNFDHDSGALTSHPVEPGATHGAMMHGFMCAAIICGNGAKNREFELGIAPEGRWAGVVTARRMEAAIEWAVLQRADTYSMSFSKPGEGEYRSHRRKVMEHGSLCGVCFVSGAGNFALQAKVPVQMRQPEDIPNVVFSAAGVKRDLSRTPTSSKGPVEWNTEHYEDGTVAKPEVCAFNFDLPFLRLDGTARPGGLGGNSFAGPMFCGAIALMLSADPELLPWDLRAIITETALDVAAPGVDDETGHGLINCYRAVKEVLRRKAKREKRKTKRYEGLSKGDVLDVAALKEQLGSASVVVLRVAPNGQAAALGVEVGDVLLSYNGKRIRARSELREAKEEAEGAGLKKIQVVIRRGKKTLKLTFEPGQIGINARERYDEPVFR